MNSLNPLIYIIEDDEAISKLISIYLNKSEMETEIFSNAEDALESLSFSKNPDLILLDLNLPGMSGFDFLKKFREQKDQSIPIIIVSARDQDEDIIESLGLGADEFVTKPFSPSVLVAKVKANLRRQTIANAKAEESISFGDYTVLLNSCVLKKGNNKISLSTKEYEVLAFLLQNAGRTISPEEIYSAVWKVKFGDLTAVAVYIQRLRKKIEKDPTQCEYINTEFGKGYIFNIDKIIKWKLKNNLFYYV